MKEPIVVASVVFCTFLLAAGGRASANGFGNSSYSGRFACQAGSQGYYDHSSSASWVVKSKGNGYYSDGELCANPKGKYGPCNCFCYLNTDDSSYSVDYLGLVTEKLVWHNCSSYCPDPYFTDNVGGAASFTQTFQGPTITKTSITDDNTADAGEPGNGSCSQ